MVTPIERLLGHSLTVSEHRCDVFLYRCPSASLLIVYKGYENRRR
jgi:hypothetical protein